MEQNGGDHYKCDDHCNGDPKRQAHSSIVAGSCCDNPSQRKRQAHSPDDSKRQAHNNMNGYQSQRKRQACSSNDSKRQAHKNGFLPTSGRRAK
jgi:hypothetical protein